MSAGRAILRMGLLFVAAAALTAPVPGQERKVRKCASDDRYQAMLQRDPEFRAARKQLRVLTEAFEAVRESGRFGERTGPVRLPVVVHVVYHTDAQNISDEQIKSQLAALDADYQKQNPDVASVPTPFKDRVGNPLVQFALAVRGPDGKATTGITRTKSAETEFLYDGPKGEAVKFTARGGHDGWPRDSYLNLWVCPLGGDLLGYASFPGEDAGAGRRRDQLHRLRHDRNRGDALRQGPHRDPRDRPLAESLPHLGRRPGRLHGLGSGARHAEPGVAEHPVPDVPAIARAATRARGTCS